MVAKNGLVYLLKILLSEYLFVGVPVTSTFSERCTPNGTFWEFSHRSICVKVCRRTGPINGQEHMDEFSIIIFDMCKKPIICSLTNPE